MSTASSSMDGGEASDTDGVDSVDTSDCNETTWQLVRTASKRQNPESPNIHQRKRASTQERPSTSRNMFAELQSDDIEDSEINNNDTAEPKPPPIIMPDVSDIKTMTSNISKVINASEFTYKSFKDGQVRLMTKSISSYRTIVKYLDEKQIRFHTYQLKQERAYRIVVKNLHFTTPIDVIKDTIEKEGHKVRNIVNIKSRFTKEPLSMFFVDLEPGSNNKNVFNIRYIYNAVIKIEPPKKVEDVVQCHRCQQFGHSKTYCRKIYRCVKCGLNHPSSQCTKDCNVPPQCSNCLENHTASYRGCRIYKELVQKKQFNKRQNNEDNQTAFDINAHNFPSICRNNATNNNSNQYSFAEVLNSSNSQNNPFDKIEALLNKQIELTNNLINMMSLLVSKLCK